MNKIEKENGKCVKEITTWPKSRKQTKDSNGSSTQQENTTTGDMLQLDAKLYLFSENGGHTNTGTYEWTIIQKTRLN